MKALSLFALLLTTISASYAGAVTSVFINIDEQKVSVTDAPTASSVYEASIELTAAAYSVRAADFKFYENFECMYWKTQGTGPDNPGLCGEYKHMGWNIKDLTYHPFTAVLKLKNIKAGAVSTKTLNPVEFFIATGYVNLASQEVPQRFDFQGRLSMDEGFGCAVDNSLDAGKILDETVHLNICVSTPIDQLSEWFTVSKTGNAFDYSLPQSMALKVEPYAYWMVPDYPRKNMIRKDIERDVIGSGGLVRVMLPKSSN